MSELEPGAGTPPVPQASAGQLLKQAREAAGLHVAALAVALKVPVSKLEALEADRFDDLPDAVFVRALASSVCRTLRVDAAPILALLPQTQRPHLKADDAGINTPFRAPNERRLRLVPEQWFSPTLLAVPLLCVGALALYLWPRAPEGGGVSEPAVAQNAPVQAASAESASEPTPPAAADASAAAASPGTVSAPVASTGPTPVATPPGMRTEVVSSPAVAAAPGGPAAVASAAPVATPAPAGVATSVQASKSVAPAAPVTAAASNSVVAASASAAAPAPAASAAEATTAVLSFSASGTSWIKVTDARGVVTLQKTLNAGETASASGQPPFAVVVGKVDVTQLQVRGKAFDLQSVARENVARFEVK